MKNTKIEEKHRCPMSLSNLVSSGSNNSLFVVIGICMFVCFVLSRRKSPGNNTKTNNANNNSTRNHNTNNELAVSSS